MEVYKPGSVIFKQGDKADGIFLIERGIVTIVIDNVEMAHKTPVNMLKKGDIFGEISYIMQDNRNATALAQTEVVLKRIDHLKCKELLIHLVNKLKKTNEYILALDE